MNRNQLIPICVQTCCFLGVSPRPGRGVGLSAISFCSPESDGATKRMPLQSLTRKISSFRTRIGIRLGIFIFCHILTNAIYCQNNTKIEIGNKLILHSNILNEDRTCLVSLPDSYNDAAVSKKEYPVLILLDGYTHFKTASGIVHFMSSARNRNFIIPETIIVAIENVDRERDFTVTRIKTVRPNTTGGGKKFLSFIENELIPHLDKNYRTKPFRTLVGHSLGGLLTLNAYMDKNSIFNTYISIDPSIWWDEAKMKNKVNAISSVSLSKKLYIATANQGEANVIKNKKRHEDLYKLLKQKSGDVLNVGIKYYENENHRTVPLIALYEGLKYLNNKN